MDINWTSISVLLQGLISIVSKIMFPPRKKLYPLEIRKDAAEITEVQKQDLNLWKTASMLSPHASGAGYRDILRPKERNILKCPVLILIM